MIYFGLRPWEIAKLTPLQQQFYLAYYASQMKEVREK